MNISYPSNPTISMVISNPTLPRHLTLNFINKASLPFKRKFYHQRIKTGTKPSAIVVVVIMFSIYNFFCGKKQRDWWDGHACAKPQPDWSSFDKIKNANSVFDESVKLQLLT